ncbi:tripartite motif-containing protein 10-like [Patiria miniata]|uniref:Uncharacterized protein n=1 Tax=Patiria miniata TaxID=46514 RepID=A0A914A501_PATMI|nr:tripartite motif-containing protein 10-like [Patiria miniata]
MASNVTVQSVLGKISQDHLECSICSCRYKQPKVLDCLHSFCLNCLQELIEWQGPDSTKLTCPLCRRDTKLKGNDVTALPTNFTLGALVEEFTMQEQLLDEGQGSEIKCQSCDEGNEAVSRCMNCDSFLCLECDKGHSRMAALKTHDVNTLAQLRSGEISYKSKLREEVPKCGKHPDQNVSIYCNTCEQLACTTCSVLDHARHSLSGQMEALGKCRQEIAEATAKAMQQRTELSDATQEVEKIRKALDSTFMDTNKKIQQNVDEGIARVTQDGQRLKQEAEKIYKDRAKTLDAALATNSKEASNTEQKLDEMEQLIDQASCHEMLDFKQKVLHNLRELTKKLPQRVNNKLSFMDFQGGEISVAIGKLLLKDDTKTQVGAQAYKMSSDRTTKWNKRTEIHRYGKSNTKFKSASHLAVLSDNDVVTVDAGCSNLISISFKTPQSPPVTKELEIDGLHNPKRVAINKDDELIVLDGTVVKTFNRQYHPLNSFKPGACLRPNGKPTCLAVDNNNLIAIGYEKKGEISLHRPDGTLITIVSAPGIGDYLTIHRQRLIYTDWDKLRSVYYNGNEVFCTTVISNDDFDLFDDKMLKGVCCDRDGNIYVTRTASGTVHFLEGSDEILLFSPDGKQNGCAIKGCTDADEIILMPNGDLAIAAGDAVVCYQRV